MFFDRILTIRIFYKNPHGSPLHWLLTFSFNFLCFFTQTCLLTRSVIGHKISNLIANSKDTNTLSVKLKPVFEHLRQIKLQKKQKFLANVQALTGTLEKRSNSTKHILKNIHPNVNEIKGCGTRQKLLNTKIEPLHGDSKKLNVDGGT